MSKPKIYITRKLPGHLLANFQDELEIRMWDSETVPVPQDVLYEEAKKVDGILCLITEKIDQAFIEENKHLKIIANMAVGYDNINVEAARKQGIIVTNTPDVLTETTADLTFALLMATARRLLEASSYIYQDKWKDWAPFMLAGRDIHQQTIGIVGMGRIGQAVARRARGFNMNVLYHNRSRNEVAEKELAAQYVEFDDLLEQADFVVSLLPYSEATKDTFNEAAFAKMKNSAIFINVSRGGVVDEDALFTALKNKTIQAAGLDVFEYEPIDSSHPFTKLDNVVLLPHIGSASVQTREAMATLSLKNLAAVLQGQAPLTEV